MKVHSREFLDKIEAAKNNILEQTSDSKTNTSEFLKLLAILSIYRTKPFPGRLFTLIINELELDTLDFTQINSNLNGDITQELQTKNTIQVNNKFQIIESHVYNPSNSSQARQDYQDLSQNGDIILLITKTGITFFYKGIEKQAHGANVWLSNADMKKYREKKDISEVLEVLDDYRMHLTKIHVYEKFFVPKTTLNRIGYLPNKNLLKNKPEKIFQDDLKAFLNDRIAGTFNISKEVELETKKRLDINITDSSGDYYFFEIKWIGMSINPHDSAAGHSVEPNEMKDGVNQSLKYIKELGEEEKVVKLGYLIIFDAREEKTPLSLEPFDYLENGLEQYLPIFTPQACFCVDNVHPR